MYKICCLAITIMIGCIAVAQEKTIILIRHAEKDTTQQGSTMMLADPPLCAEGLARAQKLIEAVQAYPIEKIYSTNFIRTRKTVEPLASKLKLSVELYDHRKLDQLVELIKNSNAQTILVAGHSNTTPALANLLLQEKKYEALDESVYNKIFIIKLNKEKAISKIIEY